MSESVMTYADLASSKFTVLNAPVNAPGVCAICGSSNNEDRDYVDFGLTIDYVGTIYFCTFCIQELCNRMGCLTPEQSKHLEDQLDAAKQEILTFQKEKAAINDIRDTLRTSGLFSGTDLSRITSISSKDVAKESEPDLYSTLIAEPKASGSNSNAKQSDPKQRSDDVSATGNDDLADFF